MSRLPERPILMVVTDPSVPDLARRIDEAIAGGAIWVQYRDKKSGTAAPDWLQTFKQRHRDTLLFVNRDIRLANETGADGVHVPSRGYSRESIVNARRSGLLVGRSVHPDSLASSCVGATPDYFVFGTIFASASHPGDPGLGGGALEQACRMLAPTPVFAIGGITAENAGECIRAGAAGVAVIRSVLMAPDPAGAAWEIARAMREAR